MLYDLLLKKDVYSKLSLSHSNLQLIPFDGDVENIVPTIIEHVEENTTLTEQETMEVDAYFTTKSI